MCSSYKHASVQINSGGGLLVLYAENSSCSLILSNFLSCMFVSRPGSDASCKGIRFLTKKFSQAVWIQFGGDEHD